jgi:hypothetical protein
MNLEHSRGPEPARSQAIPDRAPLTASAAGMQRLAKWRSALVLAAVISLAAAISQTSAGHAVLRTAGLFKQPATYTSLAFADPQSLTENVSSGQTTTVAVAFVIENAGRSSRDYQWTMQVTQGSKSSQVASGNVTIASGRQAAITRSARISCAPGQVRVVISLADPAELIDALAACQPKQK